MDTELFQNSKNRRRLIQQNTKLNAEICKFQNQIQTFVSKQQALEVVDEVGQRKSQQIIKFREEIVLQEKFIRQLKEKLFNFKAENAHENNLYIMKEEDQLIIIKQQFEKVKDQKEIALMFLSDKKKKLEANQPLQEHRKKVAKQLKQVIKSNKEKAISLLNSEKEIRIYHLAIQDKKYPVLTDIKDLKNELKALETEIQLTNSKTKLLQEKWKPQLRSLDEQYFEKLKELEKRKQILAEKQCQHQAWETRMSVIREEEEIKKDKCRKGNIKVSEKLKKQVEEFIMMEQEKKHKKVNLDDLKYQFQKVDEKPTQEIFQINKKSPEKTILNIEDDKNILKMIDRSVGGKKIVKVDQNHNTQDISTIPKSLKSGRSSKKSKSSKNPEESISSGRKQLGNIEQERSERKWNNEQKSQTSSLFMKNRLLLRKQSESNTKKAEGEESKRLILKNIGMGTSFVMENDDGM